ncbi:hypothetical protein V6N13_018244 [Hibiscus sabdariffa]
MMMGIDNNDGAAPTSPPQLLLERLKDYGQEHNRSDHSLLASIPRAAGGGNRASARELRVIGGGQNDGGAGKVVEDGIEGYLGRQIGCFAPIWWTGRKVEGMIKGTRVGSSDPKGCFNIGLPSGKSLFQLQAERILCAQRLATQAMKEGSAGSVTIHWYIMTSPFTDDATRKFFESHKYFGLEADQVTFFQQGIIPCISKDGQYIMETRFKVAKSPDGNGGVYSALKSSRLLENMAMRGIKYVDCYGVDNALVRVADPTFLGYFIDKGVGAAAKVVRKAYPQEKVGVFVRRGKGGPLTVVEYSELDQSLASAINQQTGRLRFCWSNVLREEEFAPVKNVNGSNYDTPDSARLFVLRLHARWVAAAGGFLTHSAPLAWRYHHFVLMLAKT